MSATANVLAIRVGDRHDPVIDGKPALGDLAGIVIILALADLNLHVGFDHGAVGLLEPLLPRLRWLPRELASASAGMAATVGFHAGPVASPCLTTPVTTIVTSNTTSRVSPAARSSASLSALACSTLARASASDPGHDVKRHADDFAGLDLLRETPLSLGLQPLKGRIEFVVVNVIHSAALVPGPFQAPLLLPRGQGSLAQHLDHVIQLVRRPIR